MPEAGPGRRSAHPAGRRRACHADLAADHDQCRVCVASQEIRLKATECEQLGDLSAAVGRIVTTEASTPAGLRGRRAGDDSDRVRTAVKRPRVKLGDESVDNLRFQRARHRPT